MKKVKKIIWSVVLIVSTNNLFASGITIDESSYATLDPTDPGSDPGTASINMFLIPMIIIGIYIAYYLIKNNYLSPHPLKKKSNSN